MTTSEFIKMLQEADPEGNAHVKTGFGVPVAAHVVPGYYDGSYLYFDGEKLTGSIKNNKIVIETLNPFDYTFHVLDTWPLNKLYPSFEELFEQYFDVKQLHERDQERIRKESKQGYDEFTKI